MAPDWIYSNEYQYITIVWAWISLVIVVTIFVYEFIYFIKNFKTFNVCEAKTYLLMRLIIYVLYMFYVLFSIVVYMKWSYNCFVFETLCIICFTLAKGLTYAWYLFRLYAIYSQSTFQFNTKLILSCGTFLVSYTLATLALILIYYDIESNVQNIVIYCPGNVPDWIFICSALFDQCVGFGSLYWFTKPLVYLLKSISNYDKAKSDQKTFIESNKQYKLIVKLYTLSSIQIMTTFLTFALQPVLPLRGLFFTDICVNVICFTLMTNYGCNNKIYSRICYPINLLCHNCLLCCCIKGPKTTNIEFEFISNMELTTQLSNTN